MRVIGICGLGYTGSGAVVDLLKEYDEFKRQHFMDLEFSISYIPDGLEDLEYHLMNAPSRYMSCDVAINRFIKLVNGRNNKGSALRKATNNQFKKLSMEYIGSIVQAKWRGYWGFDFYSAGFFKRNFIFRFLENRIMKPFKRHFNLRPDIPPVRDMYLSIEPDGFLIKTKKYLKLLILSMGWNENDTVLLNQPFSADNPIKSFKFFENPQALIVNRDPRDLYVLIKKKSLLDGSFIPVDDVNTFIEYYKRLNRNRYNKHNDDRVLELRFEDLIYKYDETVEQIENFLSVNLHKYPKKYFDPNVSIKNTQLYLKFPELSHDIQLIEKELVDYLYPFNQSLKVETKFDEIF